jgi:hypothetical protein
LLQCKTVLAHIDAYTVYDALQHELGSAAFLDVSSLNLAALRRRLFFAPAIPEFAQENLPRYLPPKNAGDLYV